MDRTGAAARCVVVGRSTSGGGVETDSRSLFNSNGLYLDGQGVLIVSGRIALVGRSTTRLLQPTKKSIILNGNINISTLFLDKGMRVCVLGWERS